MFRESPNNDFPYILEQKDPHTLSGLEINGSPVARGYLILLRATGFQKVVARRATGFHASLYTQNIIYIK